MASSDENDNGLDENEDVIDAEELFEDENENVFGEEDVESVKGGDTEDDTKKKEKPKPIIKKTVKNPRVVLNFERLKGPNGFDALVENFENFKFKGKHFEKEDLTAIMNTMQHWMCHHLYPGYDIETCMKELENLGEKRVVQTHMRKMRQEAKFGALKKKEDVSDHDSDCPPSFSRDGFDDLLREEPMEI